MGSCTYENDFEKNYIPNQKEISDSITLLLNKQSLAFRNSKFDVNYEIQDTIGSGFII